MYLQSSVEWHILTRERRSSGAELPERMAWHSCSWGELLLRKEWSWGGAWPVVSVDGGSGRQAELKGPHPCFSRCLFCNISLFFFFKKRQHIQSFRELSDKKREKPGLCCAFLKCFTASGTSFYNTFSITGSPTHSLPLIFFLITLLLCLILYNVSNPLL